MFINYLKTTLRNFLKNKLFSLINIIGLSIGLACSILIILAVIEELNYDSFNTNYKRIYRVIQDMPFTKKTTWAITQGPLGPALLDEIPEIEQMTRTHSGGWTIKFEEEELHSYGIYVDPSFLDIFSYELISGSKESVLSNPYSVILTQELAGRIFGDTDPVGIKRSPNRFTPKIRMGICHGICKRNWLFGRLLEEQHLLYLFIVTRRI